MSANIIPLKLHIKQTDHAVLEGKILNQYLNKKPDFSEIIQISFHHNGFYITGIHGIWPCNKEKIAYCFNCINDASLSGNIETILATKRQRYIDEKVEKEIYDYFCNAILNEEQEQIKFDGSISHDQFIQYFKHGSVMSFENNELPLFASPLPEQTQMQRNQTLNYHRKCFKIYERLLKKYSTLTKNVQNNFDLLKNTSIGDEVIGGDIDKYLRTEFICDGRNIIFYLNGDFSTKDQFKKIRF